MGRTPKSGPQITPLTETRNPAQIFPHISRPRRRLCEKSIPISRIERPHRLLISRQIPGQRRHDATGRIRRRSLICAFRLPRFIHQSPNRSRRSARLLLQPLPVPGQKRDFPRHHSQPRPPRLRCRNHRRHRPRPCFSRSSAQVKVDLSSLRIIEDEYSLDLPRRQMLHHLAHPARSDTLRPHKGRNHRLTAH